MSKFDVLAIISALEAFHDEDEERDELVTLTTALFIPPFQEVLNIYSEIIGGHTSRVSGFAKSFLITRSVNDLLAGFHLMRKGYIAQAYSVLRPILESCDLISLFDLDPEMAEIWAKGTRKEKRALKPAEVRRRLGKPGFDEMYSHFCEAGSHPAFESSRSMVAQKTNQSSEAKKEVTMWVGGVIFEPAFVFQASFCFILLNILWQKVISLSPDSISTDRYIKTSKLILSSLTTFTERKSEYFGSGLPEGDELKRIQDELQDILDRADTSQ